MLSIRDAVLTVSPMSVYLKPCTKIALNRITKGSESLPPSVNEHIYVIFVSIYRVMNRSYQFEEIHQ